VTVRINSAEGGTNGATVTVANSGGLSGDAFDFTDVPAGTTFTVATAAAYKGTKGYRFTQGTGSGYGAYGRWGLSGWTVARLRLYFRTSAYPSANTCPVGVTNGANTSYLGTVWLTPTGNLQVRNTSGTVLYTSAVIPLNSWVRIELIVVPGTTPTNGQIRFAWGLADAAATETYYAPSANTGTAGTLGKLYFGKTAGVWNATTDFDDLLIDDQSATTYLGPSGSGAVVVDPTPPAPVPPPSWPPPDPYSRAIRSAVAIWYSVSASLNGSPVAGATDLRPTGGTITDTSKPGVRRVLNLELAPEPGLFDRLSPIGTALTVTAHVQYANRTVVDIPMGVFDVDSEKLSEGGGALSLTAPDKWAKIQRAKFFNPAASYPDVTVIEQLVNMIRAATSATEPVTVTASSAALMTPQVWDKDRDRAIIDLATSIGAWVFFDRYGVATIADIPTAGASADWLVDASASGVMTELDRERSRSNTYNVVVIDSSATDGARFPTTFVWDNDAGSPTYAGTDPMYGTNAGPFGVVPYFYETPVLSSTAEAQVAGRTILSRVAGLASQVSLGQVPNPAVDAFDVIDVLPPKERYDIARVLERHVVDTVTHPLTVGGSQHIEGRSTRIEEFS
jgi:hypothetical protein